MLLAKARENLWKRAQERGEKDSDMTEENMKALGEEIAKKCK